MSKKKPSIPMLPLINVFDWGWDIVPKKQRTKLKELNDDLKSFWEKGIGLQKSTLDDSKDQHDQFFVFMQDMMDNFAEAFPEEMPWVPSWFISPKSFWKEMKEWEKIANRHFRSQVDSWADFLIKNQEKAIRQISEMQKSVEKQGKVIEVEVVVEKRAEEKPHLAASKSATTATKETSQTKAKAAPKPASKTTAKKNSKPAAKSSAKPAAKTAAKQTPKAAAKTTAAKTTGAATKNASKPASKPAAKAASKETPKAAAASESIKTAAKETPKTTTAASSNAATKTANKTVATPAAKETPKPAAKENPKTATKQPVKAATKETPKAASKETPKTTKDSSKKSSKKASKKSK